MAGSKLIMIIISELTNSDLVESFKIKEIKEKSNRKNQIPRAM